MIGNDPKRTNQHSHLISIERAIALTELAACWKLDIGDEVTDMPAYEPEECDLLLFEVLKSGDLDAAMDLYEPDAIFVVSPDQVIVGHAAIRKYLQGIIESNATGKLDAVTAVRSADGCIAFTRAKGKGAGRGSDGKPVTTQFHSIEVVRKQPDGTWRFIIDDPNATGLGGELADSRP